MDAKRFKKVSERLREVNALITKLDPAIRAEAFSIFVPYVKGASGSQGASRPTGDTSVNKARHELLEEHGGSTPVDNVLLASAIWFSEFGSSPFGQEDIQQIIDEAGLTGPVRLDRTFDTTTKGQGKKLFRKVSRGRWTPSVPGEQYFKDAFGVSKGQGTPRSEDS